MAFTDNITALCEGTIQPGPVAYRRQRCRVCACPLETAGERDEGRGDICYSCLIAERVITVRDALQAQIDALRAEIEELRARR